MHHRLLAGPTAGAAGDARDRRGGPRDVLARTGPSELGVLLAGYATSPPT
jgi:hypothetical protein